MDGEVGKDFTKKQLLFPLSDHSMVASICSLVYLQILNLWKAVRKSNVDKKGWERLMWATLNVCSYWREQIFATCTQTCWWKKETGRRGGGGALYLTPSSAQWYRVPSTITRLLIKSVVQVSEKPTPVFQILPKLIFGVVRTRHITP